MPNRHDRRAEAARRGKPAKSPRTIRRTEARKPDAAESRPAGGRPPRFPGRTGGR
ncbi:hypothetical protein HKCCE2091_07925 [Rhodobacterales bacterium HKCCE2091]|nr:hypothetical protein [Rhodobacterales bacterium HKCCE2091]